MSLHYYNSKQSICTDALAVMEDWPVMPIISSSLHLNSTHSRSVLLILTLGGKRVGVSLPVDHLMMQITGFCSSTDLKL